MANIAVFANNDTTTLAATITSSQTSITLVNGASFPTPAAGQFFPLTLISASNSSIFEITHCTARSGNTVTVVRGQEGTTAAAFNAGDLAQNLLTAAVMSQMMQWPQQGMQAFFTSGTFTVPPGVTSVYVHGWGAGGGGGGASAVGGAAVGGAGAGYFEGVYPVTPGAVIPITIGAAGIGASGSGTGTSGGTTSFGTLATATGGSGGLGATSGAQLIPSTPGTAVGGAVNIPGLEGINGLQIAGVGFGSQGGSTFCSPPPPISNGAGSSPSSPGVGGSGGANGNPGADGYGGLIIIRY
ncbi:MAG TPA: hypothetical protein VHB27_12015 [Rhodopila sp.]|uniref:glycine-rich domain-containing protein n=1 Tax=Rhodopila sp. TaxID=2480087 RepID=UPI002B8C12E3|nr:hypothetical protein [Rhodopila sp.]HVY15946.1 hypothetical protein [Rhodopila sp.]